MPDELVHYELMREMSWSFNDLMNTPRYVIRYCWDLMVARREAEHDAAKRAEAG